jgi:tetratricopeptide (TPR) repeat protein
LITTDAPRGAFRLAAALCALLLTALVPVGAQPPPAPAAAPSEAQQVEALVRERKYDEAIKRADEVLAKNPRNLQVRFLRAVVLSDTGKAAKRPRIRGDDAGLPGAARAVQQPGGDARRRRPLRDARALLQRAIDVAPNYVTARENLGDLHLAIAADLYAQALKLDPGNAALKSKLQLARDVSAKLRAVR